MRQEVTVLQFQNKTNTYVLILHTKTLYTDRLKNMIASHFAILGWGGGDRQPSGWTRLSAPTHPINSVT